jgi:general secretion pathway protein D
LERSRIILWALVLVAAGVIIWRVGLIPESYVPSVERQAEAQAGPVTGGPNESEDKSAGSEPNRPAEVKTSTEPNTPAAGDESDTSARTVKPGEPNAPPTEAGEADKAKAAEPNEPNDPNNPMEAVNLKDVEMKNIIEKLAQWTGKTVIPHEEVMKQKITIYAPAKLPRKKAIEKIYSALRLKGFMVEEVDDTIFLKPLAGAKLGVVPTVGPDEPLAAFENKDQIVQKLFKLANYPASQMGQIVQPLVGDYGHVTADDTTSTLLVIDTVGNLLRIERVIDQFDTPEVGKATTEIIDVRFGDPAEIVQLLRMLLGEAPSGSYRGRGPVSGRPNRPAANPNPGGQPQTPGAAKGGAATSVTITGTDIPIVLIPESKQKCIIVSASPEDMAKIREWVAKLDREEPVKSEYETIAIQYADPQEVAQRIENALDRLPGTELRPSVVVQPLQQSRQIMIFGRADLRDMVKRLIAEVDIPAGVFETRQFQLKHADPEQIKENLENLYGETYPRYEYYTYMRYGPGGRRTPADTVKAIPLAAMQQITVIASPENMQKIEKQIEEWDVPLDVDAVKPRIIELRNSDPVQMANLLTKLFSEEQDSAASSLIRYIFYGDNNDQRKKIVGPLYGQLTFEEVPGTKKIIVISKIPQAYDVVEQLIYDLDRQEMAEIPRVVQIKYADTEDLAERLNAMFNEPGTNAPIRRIVQGLGDYSMDDSGRGQNQGNANNQGNRNNQGNSNAYMPWWSSGARRNPNEEPISNVIGRVRFIPDPRSKSILVLAPPEFHDKIEETIKELDVPGKQVMIKAVVVEVDHQDLTSLGLQLSSNPGEAFGVGEDAVTAVSSLAYLDQRGATQLGLNTSVTALIDFLVKKVNAQILNQQTLWTEDNEEASFFKGQMIAFQTNATTSETGISRTQSFVYEKVGMTLAVRPSITPEKNVDMVVTVLLSDLTGDDINSQPVRRVMDTKTNMLIKDGQTLMLGGILFQNDSKVLRKIPLLGDLPLVGGAFRHNDSSKRNNELIVFITPYVIDEAEELSDATRQQIEGPTQKLDQIQGDLNEMSEKLQDSVQK